MQPANNHDAVLSQLTAPGAPFELTQVDDGGRPATVYRSANSNLAELINKGREHGDATFIVYEGETFSFRRFFAEADALAAWMHAQGVVTGDRVAIAMRNRPQWAVAFAAAVLAGAIPAPVNSFGKGAQLRRAIQGLAPRVLCVDTDRLQRLEGNLGSQGCEHVLRVGPAAQTEPEATPVHAYDQAIETDPAGMPKVCPAPEDPALILFTSGATSTAKGVVSTHRAVCQSVANIGFIGAYSAMTSPELVNKLMASGHEQATLVVVPLFHVSGLHAILLSSLQTGRKLVFLHRWDPHDALRLMREEKITQFNGAPAMVRQLMAEEAFADPQIRERLGAVGFGGSGAPSSLVDRVFSELPGRMVGAGFGMTESNGVGSAVSGDLFQAHPKSSGLISPLMEVRIVDEQGDSLPAGEVGEIWLRGAPVMQEYWQDPETTRRTLTDGWLHTGDLGYLDADGYLYVVGRTKDMINRSGENIAAVEVEECLMEHPSVCEAAVFGVPDEMVGEAVCAVVSVNDTAQVEAQQLREHVRAHLAGYKVPRDIHLHRGTLPRNPAGKLIKPQIKKDFLSAG